MIPETLEGWTLETIRKLATDGPDENDLYDFKEDLMEKDEQPKPVAAFANTRGGFLIFGVNRRRELVGVRASEFPKRFGDSIRKRLEPSVQYEFGPPLSVAKGRAVFVVHIPRSQRGPHAVVVDDFGPRFLTRTPGGSCVPMKYDEVRLAFQDAELKRTSLELLRSELDTFVTLSDMLRDEAKREMEAGKFAFNLQMIRYPMEPIQQLLPTLLSVMTQDRKAWNALTSLRNAAAMSNALASNLERRACVPSGLNASMLGFYRHNFVQYADLIATLVPLIHAAANAFLQTNSSTATGSTATEKTPRKRVTKKSLATPATRAEQVVVDGAEHS